MSILDGQDTAAAPAPVSAPVAPAPSLLGVQTAPIQIPVISALNLAAMTTAQGVTIVFYNQMPDQNWSKNAPMHQVPIAAVNLPPAQAKDLMLMLMEIIPNHEQMYGEIFTPYMHEKGLRELSTKQ